MRRQAITWTNADLLSFEPLGTNFSEILIEILTFSFKKMRLKMSSVTASAILFIGKWVKLTQQKMNTRKIEWSFITPYGTQHNMNMS